MGLVEHHAVNRPERPICSICIANYNGADLLDACLASVLEQQGEFELEIVVHDDASADESVALLLERYPQVEVLVSEENVGFCVANNRMVARARGEFVLLLNNDAALHRDAIFSLVMASRSEPGERIMTLPQYDWESGELVDRGCLLDPFYNPVPNMDPSRSVVAMTIGACLWLPRQLWENLGGFPEWMGSIGEDLYLCSMARLRGGQVEVLAGSGYRHRQGQSFGGNKAVSGKLQTSVRRRRLSERNKTFAMVVLTPSPLVWLLLILHLGLLAAEGAAMALLRWNLSMAWEIYAGVFVSVVKELKRLRGIRKEVMRARVVTLQDYLRVFTFVPRKLSMLMRYGIPSVRP